MMSPDTALHIRTLHSALTRLRIAIEAANPMVPLDRMTQLTGALAEAWNADAAHSKWLLSDRE